MYYWRHCDAKSAMRILPCLSFTNKAQAYIKKAMTLTPMGYATTGFRFNWRKLEWLWKSTQWASSDCYILWKIGKFMEIKAWFIFLWMQMQYEFWRHKFGPVKLLPNICCEKQPCDVKIHLAFEGSSECFVQQKLHNLVEPFVNELFGTKFYCNGLL